MISVTDVVKFEISQKDLLTCIEYAKGIMSAVIDRPDLHNRDDLERFNNILMGEVSEMMVMRWLHSNGKYAVSAVDKTSKQPDLGHDLHLRALIKGKEVPILCSIKSSLSALKDLDYIVNNFKLATKQSELREVNIQVYFWLVTTPNEFHPNRTTVLSLRGAKDLGSFERYATEYREVPTEPLCKSRSMESLLHLLC